MGNLDDGIGAVLRRLTAACDRGVASLIMKPNKRMKNGTLSPPPPIPAHAAMNTPSTNTADPTNSLDNIGKSCL